MYSGCMGCAEPLICLSLESGVPSNAINLLVNISHEKLNRIRNYESKLIRVEIRKHNFINGLFLTFFNAQETAEKHSAQRGLKEDSVRAILDAIRKPEIVAAHGPPSTGLLENFNSDVSCFTCSTVWKQWSNHLWRWPNCLSIVSLSHESYVYCQLF